ncbi:outer membrane autotransporter barrel domain (plasmid) [Enterobacter sp. 638]|uniref:Outer membrane autotransporter barrel domain n=1 Tax=Enterobacter sp. (strain 638) TaxID=399742 RepID=A0A9J9GJZ2_ENT38|nr:outer membrane autotransporter barrel domain [Enterobacter sp. 638]
MSKNITNPTAIDRRKVLGLSIGSAIALLSSAEVYSACIALGNTATVTGTTGCVTWSGGNLTLTNAGTLISTGAAPVTATSAAGTLLNNGLLSGTSAAGVENTANALIVQNNSTIISNTIGLNNNGTIVSLNNNAGGTISGSVAGVKNNSFIMSLSNNNIISGGLGINNGGTLGSLANSGTLTGTTTGVYNSGLITNLSNSGSLSGTSYGIQSDNGSQILSLQNTSTGIIEGGTGVLVGNLTPSGTINVNTLTNAGQISGTTNVGVGTSSNGTIGSLNNTGTLVGSLGGVGNAGTIGSLVNSGTISSSGYAVYNAGSGTFGPITNSGMIAGTIYNGATRSMTINGSNDATFGTLTGASGGTGSADIGMLYSTSADLFFASGNLLLNDNIQAGSKTVNNTGATLQVNNILSITGNYVQRASAALVVGVGDVAVSNGVSADTGYGRLIVSGAATIDNGSTVALKSLNTYRFAPGQRYVVITAAQNGTNYNANSLNYLTSAYEGVTSGSVVDSGNTSSLVVSLGAKATDSGTGTPGVPTNPGTGTPGVPTNPGTGTPGGGETPVTPGFATTGNAISSLSGLKQYTGIAPGLLDLYNASLAIDSTRDANKVGEQLSPVQNSSASNVASVATFDAVGVVGQRVDSVRLAHTQGMSGVATGDDPTDWAAWGQVFGGHANQGMVDSVSGYKANYSGLVLGVDRAMGDAWRVGGALTYSYTSVHGEDNLSGNKTGVDSYGLIGYASYTGDPWYVNLSASVTQQRYDTSRKVNMTGYSDSAWGKFNGQQYVTKAEFGYPLAVADTTTLTPLANLSYSYQTLDSYKESSGNGSALSVESSHNNAFRSGLGAKLEKSFQTGIGDIVPYVQAVWTHQYDSKQSTTNASYAADTIGETSFTTFGASPVEDTADLSLGTTVLNSDTLSVTARYTAQFGEQYQGQTVSLQVRKLF